MKTCEWCNQTYDGEGERFCSHGCYLDWTKHYGKRGNRRRVCKQCHVEYKMDPRSENSIFCSKTCYNQHKREHPDQYEQSKSVSVACEYCGKPFDKKRSQYLKTPHHYCSRSCSNKAHSEAIKKNHALAERQQQSATCPFCGKSFYVKPNQVGKRKFCSRACAYASRFGKKHEVAVSRDISGNRNPNFRGKNNPATARVNALKFFGAKCMICGWDEVVDVHHIVARRHGGSNNLENLIVLCPNHHKLADLGRLDAETLVRTTHAAIAELSDPLPRFDLLESGPPETAQPSLLSVEPARASQSD